MRRETGELVGGGPTPEPVPERAGVGGAAAAARPTEPAPPATPDGAAARATSDGGAEPDTPGAPGAPGAPPGGSRRRPGLLRRAGQAAVALWLLVLLATVWWFTSADSTSPYFPPLRTILARLYELWIVGDAKRELVPSLTHFAVGYPIAGVVGVTVGALLWNARPVRESVSPLLYFLYVLPAPALLPAVTTFFGIEDTMKIVIIAFTCVWPTLLNTLDGMRGVDEVKLDSARALGLSRPRTVWSVVLPAALPQIVAGLRSSLQVAIILMVVSEVSASNSGIGYFILNAQQSFAIVDMWTGIIVLAVVGSALNAVFVAVERRVLAWHYGARAAEERS